MKETSSEARHTVETIRRIEKWAKDNGITMPPSFALDLGEAYRSATVLISGVDVLLAGDQGVREVAAALARLQAWTYGDLVDHLNRLEGPLDQVLEQLHSRLGGVESS